MSDHEPQGSPKSGNIEVTPEVIADLRARSEMGRAKYGTVLRSMNGRSALTDLYQEILDGACYLKQRLIEEEDIPKLIAERDEARTCLRDLLEILDSEHIRRAESLVRNHGCELDRATSERYGAMIKHARAHLAGEKL